MLPLIESGEELPLVIPLQRENQEEIGEWPDYCFETGTQEQGNNCFEAVEDYPYSLAA
jgi:uncharacterized protein YeaC (DUF1315 family)